jgi:AAA domain-containing protein
VRENYEGLLEGVEPFAVATSKMLYDAPAVDFLIEGLLPTHAICGLTGTPGTGKTWLAMEMARAVVTGTKFLGQFETRQAPALFIGSDQSLLDYAQQWRRLTKEAYDSYEGIGGDEGQRIENPFDSYAHFLIQSEFNLDDIAMIARLIRTSAQVERPSYVEEILTEEGWEQIEKEGKHYGLIVYDTLTKLTRTPENDNVGRDTVFSHLRDIAEATGATLLLLHHPTLVSEFRTGEEWRGAGSQFGALDVHYHILKNNGRDDNILLKVKKFRGITPKPFLFSLNVFENGDEASLDFIEQSKDVTDYDAEMMDALVKILHARNNEPTTIADWAIQMMARPEWSDQYNGNIKKLKNRIRNLLNVETKKADTPIVQITSGAGRSSLYKLNPEKKDESREGD